MSGKKAGSKNKLHISISVYGTRFQARRIIFALHLGLPTPAKLEIDHIDGNRHDSAPHSLRLCRHSQNMQNRCLPSNNKSGVVGVLWAVDRKKWHSSIKIKGRINHLRSFTDKADAVKARLAAEDAFGFGPNHGKAT